MKLIEVDPAAVRCLASRSVIRNDARTSRSVFARREGFRHPTVLALGAALMFAAAAGCNPGAGGQTGGGSGSGNTVGDIVDQPDPGIGSLHFVVDQNGGGNSNGPRMLSLSWGRLANIYDSTGTLQQRDMVIGRDIPSVDLATFSLQINAVTDETVVTIDHPYGTQAYRDAFLMLDQNLTPIVDKSLSPNELPPYSMAPRNSALLVRFDDLLDSTTIQSATLKLLTGNPPLVPFDTRVIPDINHGDTADFTHKDPVSGQEVPGGDGVPEFHTTRVILDTTVSELESAGSNPPLPVNVLGLPQSPTANLPNVAVRIPTLQNASAGQLAILRNCTGRGISYTQSGPTDPNSSTHDVVRALRSGNNFDQYHGFLFDDIHPQVVGTQPVFLGTVIQPLPGEYQTSVTFSFLNCASRLKAGDVIQQPGVFGQVTQVSADPAGGTVAVVDFKIIFPPTGALTAGPAQVSSVFDSVVNFGQQACFVRFPNVGQPPATRVATDSSVIVRFSEPIDPLTIKPFDTYTITRVPGTPLYNQYIVGQVTPSSDLRQFTFVPVLPFKHVNATAESYYVNLAQGASGPTDLAGNELESTSLLPQIQFSIDPTEATENTGGFALRFSSSDEVNNGTPDGPELRGQFLYDLGAGVLRPRTVSRFAAAATRDKPVPAIMPIPPSGVQTPLSPLGSKLQMLWRYCDVGFGLLDESFYNVDVEGLDWAPVGGSVVSDVYDRFEIWLSHGLRLPDESINTATLLPLYTTSGVGATYSTNVLDSVNDPPRVVHPRARGYNVLSSDRFASSTTPSVTMMPFPWNRNLPISQHTFYTWRDTALQAKGAPVPPGAELAIVIQVLNLGGAGGLTPGTPYGPGTVPTIGLPLLMEFRCFPDQTALGLNSFDINIAINSSSLPNFRAFSTGGTNSSGTPVVRDPDLQSVATGGFNPNSNPPGQPTIPVDNAFYIGQMDLIIRLSRAHSIWFNSGSATVVYSTPVVEPRDVDQPSGTQIQLAYRGATTVSGNAAVTATSLDFYGEPQTGGGTVTYLNNDTTWKSSLSQLQGARFFQVRITFVSNAETLLAPELSALGFAFRL